MLLKQFVIEFQPIKIHSSVLYKKFLHNKAFKIIEKKNIQTNLNNAYCKITKFISQVL